MKSIFRIVIGMVLMGGSLMAQVVFDLQQQHFSNSLKDEKIGSKYELQESYVTTNMNLKSDTYNYQGDGHFHVELKEALQTWHMTYDLRIHLGGNDTITLYDESGQSFVMAFRDGKIYFDNKEVYSDTYITGTIQLSRSGSEIVLTINGAELETTEGLSFGQLKTVQTKFLYGGDYLHSLIIASS